MTSKLLPTPTEISLVRLPNTFCIPPAFWILTILNKDERKDCVRMEKKKKSEKLTSVCLLLWRQTLKWCFCLSCTRACFSKQIMLLETGECSSTGLLRRHNSEYDSWLVGIIKFGSHFLNLQSQTNTSFHIWWTMFAGQDVSAAVRCFIITS